MNFVTISLMLYRKEGMKNTQILVDRDSRHKVRIAIDGELDRIKKRLTDYKDRKIIYSTISKKPKIRNRRYRKKIKNLIYSRNTLRRALKLISMVK